MTKTLGLDLGSNSIGWALIDETNREIIGTGVRIFQQGVMDLGTSKEKSKNASRREARQLRRQHFRRRMRKKLLKKVLLEYGLMPSSTNLLDDWFRMNPYYLRHKGISEELQPFEIGRVLYHLAQHRGFLSNRKAEKEDDGKIFQGKEDTGTKGIDELREALENSGTTLGSYLYAIGPREGEPFQQTERVRNRYTLRKMYMDELSRIWDFQKAYRPDLLTEELWDRIGYKASPGKKDGILFFQRPLKSQRQNLGKCTFESRKILDPKTGRSIVIGKPKAHSSHPDFEEYRALQFINSIRYGQDEPLNQQQRVILIDLLLSKDKDVLFLDLKKKLMMDNVLFNYDDDLKVSGCPTTAKLSKLFGKETWAKHKYDIWNCFVFYTDNERLEKKLLSDFSLDPGKVSKIKAIRLDQSYSSLSIKAIRNILPFLRKGYLYNHAVVLGGILNAFGIERWEQLAPEQKDFIEDTVADILSDSHPLGETIQLIREFLSMEFFLTDKDLDKLYHHSQIGRNGELLDELPIPKDFRNPVVQTAVVELRKVVNAIIERFGKPDVVKVEMARELKLPAKDRKRIVLDNRRRQEINDEARSFVVSQGLKPSRNNIQKYILWKEMEQRTKSGPVCCPYTGKTINISDLFDDNRFQIEHIIPYSISLDDSLANKTLCDSRENQAKLNKTPFEYYGHEEKAWAEMKTRAFRLLPYTKAKKFAAESRDDIEGFISRQMNDTRYISREAKDYLSLVIPKVFVMPGSLTATLRRMWGLNSILNPDDDSKSRDDHRHHAVDALTIACIRPYYLHELSRRHGLGLQGLRNPLPEPWVGFLGQAKRSIDAIWVSHRMNNPVLTRVVKMIRKDGKTYRSQGWAAKGQLHKETIFGQHTDEQGNTY